MAQGRLPKGLSIGARGEPGQGAHEERFRRPKHRRGEECSGFPVLTGKEAHGLGVARPKVGEGRKAAAAAEELPLGQERVFATQGPRFRRHLKVVNVRRQQARREGQAPGQRRKILHDDVEIYEPLEGVFPAAGPVIENGHKPFPIAICDSP